MDDAEFLTDTADRLAALPGVIAVALGGSRATGTQHPDSDWDIAIYYRDRFDPRQLRAIGWDGEVFEVGAWGGGVFNGGAWLHIDGRKVDVHYRDLVQVEREWQEARAGRFRIEPLLFHLAGIPSYLVVGELAVCRALHGSLPRPTFPAALQQRAPAVWWASADLLFDYAAENAARHGRVAQCAGLLVQAAMHAAHAVLAARGEWVTNEKALLARAGMAELDTILAQLGEQPEALLAVAGDARAIGEDALRAATNGGLPS